MCKLDTYTQIHTADVCFTGCPGQCSSPQEAPKLSEPRRVSTCPRLKPRIGTPNDRQHSYCSRTVQNNIIELWRVNGVALFSRVVINVRRKLELSESNIISVISLCNTAVTRIYRDAAFKPSTVSLHWNSFCFNYLFLGRSKIITLQYIRLETV